MSNINYPPFYIGQKVIGNPESPWMVRDGKIYTITKCHLSINPANGKGPFWYVGTDYDNNHGWLAPYIFLPIEEMKEVTFSEIVKEEPVSIN